METNPASLQELEERLNLLQRLKRKYGGTVTEILQFGEETQRKLNSLEGRNAGLARLQKEIEQVEGDIGREGRRFQPGAGRSFRASSRQWRRSWRCWASGRAAFRSNWRVAGVFAETKLRTSAP